jgi:salicylate hydroxylase
MAIKSNPLEVIIIGAGLGGLACAIACGRQGLKPIVLERVDKIGAVTA